MPRSMKSGEHLPGFTLQSPHPLAGREAYQCSECSGIYFPAGDPSICPYCLDELNEIESGSADDD